MEFKLLYEGELLGSGNRNTRPAEKHAIRRAFHPQLRRLWSLRLNLGWLAWREAGARLPEETDAGHTARGIRQIGQQWSRAGYEFIPLVTDKHRVRCSLDILLLRPEEDRFIFTKGDIDGQVKTLFDALRIPNTLDEAGGIGPQEDEKPFYCLLSDDKLISEVRVSAEQLLLLPNQRDLKANDAFVVISVKLNHEHSGDIGNLF